MNQTLSRLIQSSETQGLLPQSEPFRCMLCGGESTERAKTELSLGTFTERAFLEAEGTALCAACGAALKSHISYPMSPGAGWLITEGEKTKLAKVDTLSALCAPPKPPFVLSVTKRKWSNQWYWFLRAHVAYAQDIYPVAVCDPGQGTKEVTTVLVHADHAQQVLDRTSAFSETEAQTTWRPNWAKGDAQRKLARERRASVVDPRWIDDEVELLLFLAYKAKEPDKKMADTDD